jgi:phosphoglycerate dehydrogenase-like enzyme
MADAVTGRHRTVYVTSRAPVHQSMARAAAPEELDVVMLQDPDREELLSAVENAEFLVSERAGRIDAEVMAAARALRLIQRLGSRCYDIDLEAARSRGVPVCRWPLPGPAMVAEHVILQILALTRRLRATGQILHDGVDYGPPRASDANTFAINWSHQTDLVGLMGRTIGIVGLGEIGAELAVRLGPFETDVIYFNPHRLPVEAEQDLQVNYASLPDLLAASHIVCLLVPTTPETVGMTDAGFLARMRPGSFLVNSGASTTLDEEAVASAYRAGRLGGVATDGYRWEPARHDNPLLALALDPSANVVLTPHTALANVVNSVELRATEYTNLVNLLAGRPLLHRVV